MAQFTVRIELHDAQWADYDTLHAAMERQGFSRLITADDGRRYQLPLAEYDSTANLTSSRVLEIAQTAGQQHRQEEFRFGDGSKEPRLVRSPDSEEVNCGQRTLCQSQVGRCLQHLGLRAERN